MPGRKLVFAFILIFLTACGSEGAKVYKSDYRGNYPEGAFSAKIGNKIIFTNGPAVLEVSIDKDPKFFCYAVNKEVLCKLNIDVKINDGAAEKYRAATQELKELMLKSGKNKSILNEMFAYYINGEKSEEEALFVNNLKNKSIDVLQVSVSGKGADEKEAQKNAVKKSNEVVGMLTDKK
ncbi:hypothetical protein HYX06_03445 [Candidatus Woesearchaeota archaeon]|nr:hypothetical protein [Candidatus Woesearchaeota archaeon]